MMSLVVVQLSLYMVSQLICVHIPFAVAEFNKVTCCLVMIS